MSTKLSSQASSSIIIEDNLWATIVGAAHLANEALSYRPRGFQFSPSYKSGKWDGTVHMLKHQDSGYAFPAGLLQYVQDYLAVRGVTPEIVDQRVKPSPTVIIFSNKPKVTLDDHQSEAVEALIAGERGVVYYPTGTGKTIIMGETIRRLRVPTIVLCGTKVLLRQLHTELERLTGAPVGIIGDGAWEPRVLTVAMFQSLSYRLRGRKDRHPKENKELRDETLATLAVFQCAVADEGHHTEAPTFEAVMKALPNAYYRYAFSATPFKSGRNEDRETLLRVQGWTGPVVSYLSISAGVRTGRIVPTDMFVMHYQAEKRDGPPPFNYIEEVDAYIVHASARNDLICCLAEALSRRGPTVVIVDRLEHGEYLALNLRRPFIHGSVKSSERESTWRRFREGKLNLVIVSKIGDEGLDLPQVKFLVLAGGGKAQHRQVQRLGRGMRAVDGKDRLIAFDFADEGGKYLPKHYRSRRRLYEREAAYTLTDLSAVDLEEMLQ